MRSSHLVCNAPRRTAVMCCLSTALAGSLAPRRMVRSSFLFFRPGKVIIFSHTTLRLTVSRNHATTLMPLQDMSPFCSLQLVCNSCFFSIPFAPILLPHAVARTCRDIPGKCWDGVEVLDHGLHAPAPRHSLRSYRKCAHEAAVCVCVCEYGILWSALRRGGR